MAFFKFFGRTLIAVVLLTFAYTHLKYPDWNHNFYVQSYEFLYGLVGANVNVGGYSIPLPAQVNFILLTDSSTLALSDKNCWGYLRCYRNYDAVWRSTWICIPWLSNLLICSICS